ncbi:two-component system signal transduction histidine kinase [Gottschalkia purinilytica]|uniref:histidine kinase n=1 Tax=Gottschalkia purinilytica TaxID=1503 RepID=A0A0L0WDS3_GOTPU|nr:HAMP domain-containing sensor histidine kinase [Gottschalkia purinilytica]KNF09565.1 two-component system signal transduction histidine kinase [Gottschalkia purinilytica]
MIFKKEPLIKKLLTVLIISLVIIFSTLILSNYYFFKEVSKHELEIREEMIGKLSSIYPEKEKDIVKTLSSKSKSKKDYKNLGKNILKKYNYSSKIKRNMEYDFNNYFKDFLVKNLFIMIFIILINIILFVFIFKYFINKLEKVSFAIDRIMDGDFSMTVNIDKEGILSRLESQFYQMSKRLKLSLENLNSEKENIKSLVTDISHQIKTPISSIKLFNTLLTDNELEEQEKVEFLERTKEEVDKLEWLSNSLIKISRMEAGIIQLKKENKDIKKTILEAVNGIYLRALDSNIDINIMVDSINVYHDSKWTKEAIFNILENAVKYTHENGQIDITLEKLETYIKIDIEDNGIGIPSNEISNIFNRFYRGNLEKVRNSEGSGIGLYLSRKILEEQGGNVTVSSQENKGTKFTIFLTLQNCKVA